MRHFFITVIGTIIGLFAFFILLFMLLISIGLSQATSASKNIKGKQILSLDLRQPLNDHSAPSTLFATPALSVVKITRLLEQAKTDKSIEGLFIRANGIGMVPASAEEIRLALLDFKTSGKFVITHAQGFESPSLLPYYAVSASDEIWIQDTTGFAVAGLYSETEFFGGVLEKIEAQPQIDQFYEYKNAANTYTKKDFTPAHRKATTSYMTSIFETALGGISQDRGLARPDIETFLRAAPHSAEQALAAQMVDKLGQVEEARLYIRKKIDDMDAKFIDVKSYELRQNYTGDAIAFIGGQGAVVTGASADGSNPFTGGGITMGGDTLAKAIDDAAKDKAVKAIVFRVSSPGGSPAASDQIHAAIARAKAAGKPVIISMGQYAASGGYYVSANADKIVAMPTTLTGSIGVLGGKVALEKSFAKLGYNIEGLTIGGDYAGAYSVDTPFNQSQKAAYRKYLEDIYEDFTTRVAQGRGLSLETVQEIAKGRVWTGAQAKEIGLVDELGGFSRALEIAKAQVGIEPEDDFRIKRFPRPKTTAEQLEQFLGSSVALSENAGTLSDILSLPEVQAALALRRKAMMGQELAAEMPHIQ